MSPIAFAIAASLGLLVQVPASPPTTPTPAPTPVPTPAPPKPRAESRQFDFWLGEWEVKDTKGNLVGHNRIESISNGWSARKLDGHAGRQWKERERL